MSGPIRLAREWIPSKEEAEHDAPMLRALVDARLREAAMKVGEDGRSVEIDFTIESIEANGAVFDRFDHAVRDSMMLRGVRFVVSAAVPRDELWVVSRTQDGARATFKYSIDPHDAALRRVDKPPT